MYGKKWKKWNSAWSTRPIEPPRSVTFGGVVTSRGRGEELDEAAADLVGRVPFEQVAGAGDDLDRYAAAAHALDVADGQQLVLVAPQRRASGSVMRWSRLGLAAVAERPQQAGGGDVAEVAGDRRLVRARVGEAVDERLGHALGEQVAHPLGRRARRRGRGRGCASSKMPNGASSASAVTASGRSAARSAASIPPTEAPTTGHGSAPVASRASQTTVSQPR